MPRDRTTAPLVVAGIVFALVALLHLSRLYYQFPLIFDTTPVPYWVNWMGFIVSTILSIWMFCASQDRYRDRYIDSDSDRTVDRDLDRTIEKDRDRTVE